jgi:hypothetical protein
MQLCRLHYEWELLACCKDRYHLCVHTSSSFFLLPVAKWIVLGVAILLLLLLLLLLHLILLARETAV